MRTLHRLVAIVGLLAMLYVGVTGTLIQILDLHTLLTHAPETDATLQSIQEGIYGPDDFEVLTAADYHAAALPGDLDYARSLATVLQAAHSQHPDLAPRFVELRVANDVPIGQVRIANDVAAYAASNGATMTPVAVRPAALPPSLRQTLKLLHRFWFTHDTPGVWVELVCGLTMWTLLISGLVMYFRLLAARSKVGRRQWFWFLGGAWRDLHRTISLTAAVFLLAVAFSGTWLAFESVSHSLGIFMPPRGTTTDAGARRNDPSAPLSDADVQQMATATLDAVRSSEPHTPIRVLRLRVFGQVKQGVIITGGGTTRQLVFDTDTGRRASLTEPGYPASGFPFGTQTHENIKHFHSGLLLGLPARWLDLFAGLALIFLSASGLVMYFDLWRRRRHSGRNGFFWV